MSDVCVGQSTDELVVCSTLEYILLGDLRDVLQEPPNEVTQRWLSALLQALRDTLVKRFQLEEHEGYLDDVLQTFPNWSEVVAELRADHVSLCETLCQLISQVTVAADFSEIAVAVDRDLHHWIMTLETHHRREDRLIFSAVNLDLGDAD